MRKSVHTGRKIRLLSFMMAVLMAFMQPSSVMATETELPGEEENITEEGEETPETENPSEETESSDGAELPDADSAAPIKYITAVEALAEDETYFSCMYKPTPEELSGIFPETLFVWLDGEETPAELAVTWECGEDYTATKQQYYLFYPKWDETRYALAEAVRDTIEVPVITIEVPQEGGSIKNPE